MVECTALVRSRPKLRTNSLLLPVANKCSMKKSLAGRILASELLLFTFFQVFHLEEN